MLRSVPRVPGLSRLVAEHWQAACMSTSTSSPRVHVCESDAEVQKHLKAAQDANRLAVTYFTAAWCGPCRMFSPHYDQLSVLHSPEAVFLKVDIDDEGVSETTQTHGITSIPTIVFEKNGSILGKVQGADISSVRAMVEKHR